MNTIAEKPVKPRNASAGVSRGDLAYDRIESLIAHMELRPGASLTMQTLQDMTELGRTPVLEAIRKLTDDTLLDVRAGRGLRIPPIDLAREKRLLPLRKEMERFAIMEAIANATPLHISQMRKIHQALSDIEVDADNHKQIIIKQFNELDHRLDRLILDAAHEPFVARSLRPLHTIFRRIGFLYLTHCGSEADVKTNIDLHAELVKAVITRDESQALQTLEELIGFAGDMFEPLETHIDPSLFDISISPF